MTSEDGSKTAALVRAIALAALAALGLSGDLVHEPVHARGAGVW